MGISPRKVPERRDALIEAQKAQRAKVHLDLKLRELIDEGMVPALAGVLVRKEGEQIVHGQQGVRKLGAPKTGNYIHPADQFNTGSVSKVITANMIGKLMELGVFGQDPLTERYKTKLGSVLTDIWDNTTLTQYRDITIGQLITHTSGLAGVPVNDDVNDWLNYTAADLTKEKLHARRRAYVKSAVSDQPFFWPPESSAEYGGGGIIVATMAEEKTGQIYEDLVRDHYFAPLGMTNSGFGVPPGAWLHGWDATERRLKPNPETKRDAYNYHCRAPVGSFRCNAEDLGKFIAEQVCENPKATSKLARLSMQTTHVAAASTFVHGGWSASKTGSVVTGIAHNGDIGLGRADVRINLKDKYGIGAMATTGSSLGACTVDKMMLALQGMHDHWDEMFGNTNQPIQCAYAAPAAVRTATSTFVFGRTHDGRLLWHKTARSQADRVPDGDFGASRINSGIAACVLPNQLTALVAARGLENGFWCARTENGGQTWSEMSGMGVGTFLSGPALTVAAQTGAVYLAGTGEDDKMWRFRSQDGGHSWQGKGPIGEGVFTSAPALAASADGHLVHAFGRGNDMRIWRNTSPNYGDTFAPNWKPIGEGTFASGPAAICSFDGMTVYVAGRGLDNAIWWNVSTNGGQDWLEHWQRMQTGGIFSTPVLLAKGTEIELYGLGGDFRVWRNVSANQMVDWGNWQLAGPGVYL